MIYGVGINDADYDVTKVVGGVRICCPFYRKWTNMIRRVYSKSSGMKTYSECHVCDDWLTFSNFKSWMITQDWEGKELDKDLLVKGNKVYSPETCVMVSRQVNQFITGDRKSKNGFPSGVSFHKKSGKYRASCGDLSGKHKHIGLFETIEDARSSYLETKNKLAYKLSKDQSGIVSDSLIKYYNVEVE